MTIQYVASVMRAQDFSMMFPDRTTMPGQQVQKYHRMIIEGFADNKMNVQVISGVPITSANYHHKVFRGKKVADGQLTYHYLFTLNVPVIKNLLQMIGAFCMVLWSNKDGVIVCDVLNASVAFGATVAARICGKQCIGIVTDLPEMMVTGVRQDHVRMVNRIIKNCTGYVFLTEALNAHLNTKGKPYLICEGLCDRKVPQKEEAQLEHQRTETFMYAGLLDEQYGVKAMVDGFLMADLPDTELHVYGNGPYAAELRKIDQEHSNVVYHGVALNDEVVRAESLADLLINPRPTDQEFTKYSFPSKNLEYMASGTPMLTTKLPGMPSEYFDYVYLANDETAYGFCQAYRKIHDMPKQVREELGRRAKEFVLSQKNNKVQTARLMDFALALQRKAGMSVDWANNEKT